MLVKVTGRHMSVTDAMKTYAEEKASRLPRLSRRISQIQVILDFEGSMAKSELIVDVERAGDFVAREKGKDMYAAIDIAVDKLQRQLREHKERFKKHHQKGGARQGK